jgi:O-methyltransferase involved in polyketide biosynthesis
VFSRLFARAGEAGARRGKVRSVPANDRIGPTAHYTAYVWHRLGFPHADLFSTRTGAALYWAFRGAAEWINVLSPGFPSMLGFLEYRHLLIDNQLSRLRPDCVVEVGAGLSRRGVTWAVDLGTPYIEVDLPAMIALKRRRIDEAPQAVQDAARQRLALVTADVTADGFDDLLFQHIEGAERPVVIAEGLVSYLEMDGRRKLFEAVTVAFRRGAGGHFLCDLHTKDAQKQVATAMRVLKLATRTITRGQGTRPPFEDLEHVRGFFEETGFAAVERIEAKDHVEDVPRLAKLHSPAHVMLGRVEV